MLNEIPVQARTVSRFACSPCAMTQGWSSRSWTGAQRCSLRRIPLSDGSVREALLGCASPEQYPEQAAFLGASIGRCANRIANSRYTFDGETIELLPSR